MTSSLHAFHQKFCAHLSSQSYALYVRSSQPSWFDQPNNIWWRVQILAFPIMQLLHPPVASSLKSRQTYRTGSTRGQYRLRPLLLKPRTFVLRTGRAEPHKPDVYVQSSQRISTCRLAVCAICIQKTNSIPRNYRIKRTQSIQRSHSLLVLGLRAALIKIQ
jgi:hypothetical protein